MKKIDRKVQKTFSVIILVIYMMVTMVACGAKTCHYCGDPIEGDPVEAGGRVYCSFNCYMREMLLH